MVCASVKQWEDEVLCLRELLGSLQTLTWDKACVKSVLQGEVIPYLIDFMQVVLPMLKYIYHTIS